MTRKCKLYSYLLSTVAPAVIAAASMVTTSPALAQGVPPGCTGPGTKTSEGKTPQTTCLAVVQIPGNPLQSFDISWVARDIEPGWYMLADRSNAGIDLINADNLAFVGTYSQTGDPTNCPGCKFTGLKLTPQGAVDNSHSGPDGVTSHGIWVYAGDGDSTLKVIDLRQFPPNGIVQSVSTGGTTRVDEMALTLDGTLLLAANNAEDPPFATLFHANGDSVGQSNVSKIIKITVDPTIIPPGSGLSLEQPTWEPSTQRFYTSIPQIANNPPGCSSISAPFCSGGVLAIDPKNPVAVYGAFNPATNTGVIPLFSCGPNGITVGPNHNLLLGCTPGNFPPSTTTQVINADTRNTALIEGITGSDEVWFNPSIYAPRGFIGDKRYYLGASKAIKTAGSTLGSGAVLGVVDSTSVLIETIPQSSGSHSVAADAARNLIFVPQIWTRPAGTVPAGDANTVSGGPTTVGELLCGGPNGCVVVYGSPGPHPPGN